MPHTRANTKSLVPAQGSAALLHTPACHALHGATDGIEQPHSRHTPGYRGAHSAAPGSRLPGSVPMPGQDSPETTVSERQSCSKSRQRLPHSGTPSHGVVEDRRALSPAQNACAPRRPHPARITSSLKHDAPPQASQGLGLAVPRTGAARPERGRSDTQHDSYNDSTDHAARGKAGEALPGVHRGVEHGGRSVPPREPLDLWWLPVIPLERYVCLPLVGDAQVSRGALRATPAFVEGER